MRKFLVVASALLLTLSGCAQSQISDNELRDKIGQLLVVGFVGTQPNEYIIEAIEEYRVGGVILFDVNLSDRLESGGYGPRNIESPSQIIALNQSIQQIGRDAGLPKLFIAIDQEGGRVNRLKAKYGFRESVSAWRLGQSHSISNTLQESQATAAALVELGININFTPSVDLAINPQNPIIAKVERAFSNNKDSVLKHSQEWVNGHREHSIITSLKHFPGHGSSIEDSHHGLVDITNTWSKDELYPYAELISDGYNDIVMVGHLFNSNIDSEYPSSLSSKTLDILRVDMGYDGVIATDDMNMGAIVNEYSLERALSLALNAGVDMIVMGNNAKIFEEDLVERTSNIIFRLVRSGEVSEARLEEAYNRVMKLKSRIL